MAAFENELLVRDMDDARRINVGFPCTLAVWFKSARQVFPPAKEPVAGNQVLISTGAVRFGQDGDPGEDLDNEQSEYAEVDERQPRTVALRLRAQSVTRRQFAGAASFAALENIFVQTNGVFLVAADRAITLFTSPMEAGQTLSEDIWMETDVVAGLAPHDLSQMNRMGFQSTSVIGE